MALALVPPRTGLNTGVPGASARQALTLGTATSVCASTGPGTTGPSARFEPEVTLVVNGKRLNPIAILYRSRTLRASSRLLRQVHTRRGRPGC